VVEEEVLLQVGVEEQEDYRQNYPSPITVQLQQQAYPITVGGGVDQVEVLFKWKPGK
jgi:hypothetical protein